VLSGERLRSGEPGARRVVRERGDRLRHSRVSIRISTAASVATMSLCLEYLRPLRGRRELET
jgi:hypothetical protein